MAGPGGPRRLAIVGGGGMAREALWLAREAIESFEVVGFLDDATERRGEAFDGVPILGPVADWERHDAELVVAIGAPRIRKAVVERIRAAGAPRFATLVHRSVRIGQNVAIGAGSMVAAGAVLTCDIAIGQHVLINVNCVVSHDSRLGDFATLAPGVVIPGAVSVGQGCEVALGASVRNGIALGDGAMIGMGSVVTREVEAGAMVCGAPARRMRTLAPFGDGAA